MKILNKKYFKDVSILFSINFIAYSFLMYLFFFFAWYFYIDASGLGKSGNSIIYAFWFAFEFLPFWGAIIITLTFILFLYLRYREITDFNFRISDNKITNSYFYKIFLITCCFFAVCLYIAIIWLIIETLVKDVSPNLNPLYNILLIIIALLSFAVFLYMTYIAPKKN